MWRDPRVWVAVTAALVFAALSATLTSAWEGRAEVSDVPHYAQTASQLEDGGVPYRDVGFEYPPGALAAIAPPAFVSETERGYGGFFAAEMVLCGVAMIVLMAVTLGLLGAGPGRTAAALALPALSPALLGPLLLTRFDLLPSALAAGALAAVVAGRDRLGAGVLGVGIAVKLWPGLLLPLFAARWWRCGGRSRALRLLGLCAAAVLAVVAVPFVLAPGGVAESLWRQVSRPLQIESLGAAVLLALHHAAGMPLDWASSHGSQNLTGAVAVVAAAVTGVAQVVVLGWLWVRFARGPSDAERLVRYAAAVVVAFVALGKVLSPQFLVWLLPLVPLVAGARGIAGGLLLAAACLLTRSWFPGEYWALVREFQPTASWLVLARDAALLALLGVLSWPEKGAPRVASTSARERAPARSPLHVPSLDRS